MDFLAGTYAINGATRTVGQVLVTGMGTGWYCDYTDADIISGDGLKASAANIGGVLSAEAWGLVQNGFIWLSEVDVTGSDNTSSGAGFDFLDLPGYGTDWGLDFGNYPEPKIYNYGPGFSHNEYIGVRGYGLHRSAVIVHPGTLFAGAVDGGPVGTLTPQPITPTHLALFGYTQNSAEVIYTRRVRIYALGTYAQGDLPGLSAVPQA
jgi:hypothetical protein